MLKREQRDRSHAAILSSAARLLRERGIVGMSVADVMSGAGLTVGGFYAHFASKTKLIEKTLATAFEERRARLFAGLEALAVRDKVVQVVRRYLSRGHRDAAGDGCVMPSLVSEVGGPRAAKLRPAVAGEVEALVAGFEQALAGASLTRAKKRELALGCVAMMIGGMAVARAVPGPLSDEILAAARALVAAAVDTLPAE